jgi:hypothetical protein
MGVIMQTDIYVQRKHFHYFAKCRYDERHYAECCGALQSTLPALTFHLVEKKIEQNIDRFDNDSSSQTPLQTNPFFLQGSRL